MKTIGKLFLTAATMLLIAAFVQAQDNAPKNKTNPPRPAYVDKNNDGVCDNFVTGRPGGRGANFVDKNNDGICDNRGSGRYQGRGPNFVDKNNDGICDHRQDGTGRGQGFRHRHGYGNRGNR